MRTPLLAAAILLGIFLQPALAKEVYIFHCNGSLLVALRSATAGAPTIVAGTQCAEAVKVLYDSGFKLRFVALSGQNSSSTVGDVVYTFEK